MTLLLLLACPGSTAPPSKKSKPSVACANLFSLQDDIAACEAGVGLGKTTLVVSKDDPSTAILELKNRCRQLYKVKSASAACFKGAERYMQVHVGDLPKADPGTKPRRESSSDH